MKTTTAIEIKRPEVTENKVIKGLGILQVYVPRTCFKGGTVKFFDDSQLIKKHSK